MKFLSVGQTKVTGDKCHARLTGSDVGDIRAATAEGGLSLQQIAEQYGTSRQHVSRIVRGEQRTRLPEVDLATGSLAAAVRALLAEARYDADEERARHCGRGAGREA